MGWDLYSRGEKHYFRVSFYNWWRLMFALEFVGADIEKMATDNSGKYVPAAVARKWATAIEGGVDGLQIAIISDRHCTDGEGYFLVPSSYGEKEMRELLRDYYGEAREKEVNTHDDEGKRITVKVDIDGHRSYRLKRFEPLPEGTRKFLLDFAAFCRKSGGFYQW